MSKDNRKYSNDEITVFWIPSKCIHATICFRELLEVFDPRKRPWVNMHGASTERIIEVVDRCPTGALSWKYNKDLTQSAEISENHKPEEITPSDIFREKKNEQNHNTEIILLRNGPILVEGAFRITDISGKNLKPLALTAFCRCGHSGTQPFCNGNHRKIGFKD